MNKLFLTFLLCCCSLVVAAQKTSRPYIATNEAAVQYPERIGHRRFLIFPELRESPIQWLDSLRPRWLQQDYSQRPFKLQANPGTYFVFQTGIWAIDHPLENVKIRFSDLTNGRDPLLLPVR